ncbi:hypothetical protein CVN76_01480 [Bacillus sp. mrc49]|nr:hypothetical protein CVN76_25805 [Bacillus sp. mrc49]PJN92058.1 hypothetical protein CVN76_01480 [Bacillus sp. mrc49]
MKGNETEGGETPAGNACLRETPQAHKRRGGSRTARGKGSACSAMKRSLYKLTKTLDDESLTST